MGAPVEQSAQVAISAEPEGGIRLSIRGRLDAGSVGSLWAETSAAVRGAADKRVVVDASGLSYCDTAGLGMFAEYRRVVAEAKGTLKFTDLTGDLRLLLNIGALDDPTANLLKPEQPPNFVAKVGESVAGLASEIGELIAFTGKLCHALVWAIRHPATIRCADLCVIAEKVGVNAVPVIVLLGGLVGLILAFQTAIPMQQFGGIAFIPQVLGISMIRELGPLITAVVLAGRSGSAFAAEIGTMRVTEELDALSSFGFDPMRFLVVPRVIAAVLMTPLLTIFHTVAALLCGYIVMAEFGFSFRFYANGIINSVSHVDLIGGLVKTLVFGLTICGIGCLRGLRTKTGPSAVGDSTTRAVVAGIVLIVVIDMLFGVAYFHLGI